jgi:hypothetical protein
MVPTRRGCVGAVVFALALTGCGGGGGAAPGGPVVSGSQAAPSTGPGDASNYYPVVAGDTWLFETSYAPASGGAITGTTTFAVSGPSIVQGRNVMTVTINDPQVRSTPVANYYTQSGGGLTFYGDNDPNDFANSIAPYAELLYPVKAGTVSTVQASAVAAGKTASGDPLTIDLTQTVAVAGFESVAVDAGYFQNAAKVVLSQNGTVKDKTTGQAAPFVGTETTWLAPGVGVVQGVSTVAVGAVSTSETQHLRSYNINGITHGLLAPFTAVQSTAMSQDPSGFVVAGSGTNYLGIVESASIGSYIATLFGPGGIVKSSFAISSGTRPGVYFDGTNYDVVTLQSSPPSSTALFIQRIRPDGTAVDTAPGYPSTTLSLGCDYASPSLGAVGGTKILVVFVCPGSSVLDPAGTYAAVLNTDGTASSTGQFSIYGSAGMANFAVASDGANFLVASQLGVSTPSGTQQTISAQRVTPAGAVLDSAPVLVSSASSFQAYPAVAFDGTNYLIAWADGRQSGNLIGVQSQVYGARLTQGGVLLDTPASSGGILLSASDSRVRNGVQAAFDGHEFLVYWSDRGATPLSTDARGIMAARVSSAGAVTSGPGFEIAVSGPAPVTAGNYAAVFTLLPIAVCGGTTLVPWSTGGTSVAGDVIYPF